MPQGSVRIFQLQGGQAQGPFGDRLRGEVVVLARLVGDHAGLDRRFGRMCLCEPERIARLLVQSRRHVRF